MIIIIIIYNDNNHHYNNDNNSNSESAAPHRTESDPNDDLITEVKYGIFYSQYKSRFWWWEVQILVRRMLILIVYATQYTNSKARCFGIALLCLIYFTMQLAMMPFKLEQDNLLECISLLTLCYASLTTASYPEGK